MQTKGQEYKIINQTEHTGYVWYACYGSNINRDRFMLYIEGCTDKTPPGEERAFTLPHNIYFAASSARWEDKAVAFLDDSKPGYAMGKIYKITGAQYEEIKLQEGPKYTKKIDLGTVDGLPVYTFTDTETRTDIGEPSESYFNTILNGLIETYPERSNTELKKYLLNAITGDDTLNPIAHIRTDFPTKFGIPRQSGIVNELKAMIIMEPEYRNPDAFRGLEDFSHIWLIWQFSENVNRGWSPTVRPPRLGGNTRKGVFASRSPFRPNPIGLSVVEIEKIQTDHPEYGPVIYVNGADLMDGTPIYDIKPYIPSSDIIPGASGGFTTNRRDYRVTVSFPDELLAKVPEEKRTALIKVLSEDPRPAYQNDPDRVYSFAFADLEVQFKVKDSVLTVCNVY